MINKFWQKIEEYDTICIFRHVNPDGDAYGCQYGLASFLKKQYPDKKIFCLGKENERKYGIFPETDEVDDLTVENSLAIVCDTSTIKRIDDQRCFKSRDMLKFDHHENSVLYTNYEILKDKRASCAELVAEFIDSRVKLEDLDRETATYLYVGISTDTLNFTTTNCSFESMQIASRLVRCGIELNSLDYLIHKMSKELFALRSEFDSNMVITDNHLGYGFVTGELREKYHQKYTDCKDLINEFSPIDGLLVWCMISEDANTKDRYSVSLRSRGVIINTIAAKYGGGGHRNAAGADMLAMEQVESLIKDLDQAITEYLKKE